MKSAIIINEYIKNSLNNQDLNNLIFKINNKFNLDIFINTWIKQNLNSEINISESNIKKYFENVKHINILNKKDIKLTGNLDGNVFNTNKLEWKYNINLRFKILQYISLNFKNYYDKIIILNFNILNSFTEDKIINKIDELFKLNDIKKLYFIDNNFTDYFMFGNLKDLLIFHSHFNFNLNLILKKHIGNCKSTCSLFISENHRFFSKKYRELISNYSMEPKNENTNDNNKNNEINDNQNDENEFNVDKFFNDCHREPNAINLNIKYDNISELHDIIFKIFLKGLILHFGNINNNSIDIKDIDEMKVDKISNYMLSIGFKVYFRKYDKIEVDNLIRNFLYQIKDYDCKINVCLDWKTDLIETVSINVDENKLKIKDDIEKSLEYHYECNFFLNMRKKKFLKDHVLIIEKNNIKYGLYFDIYDKIKNSNCFTDFIEKKIFC